MNIPKTLRAGDTITWDETVADYPATDSWTLVFVLYAYGKTSITITAVAYGADYLVTILPAVTSLYATGLYSWQAFVKKPSTGTITEKYSLDNGTVEIFPDLSATSGSTDLRSHVKRTLDAIELLLEGKSSGDVQSYSIGGRSLSKMTVPELLKWRDLYRTEYQRELDAQGIVAGTGIDPKRVGIRFNRI